MAIANPWIPEKKKSLQRSQLAYLPSQDSNEMNKTKLKSMFNKKYSDVKQGKIHENNLDNLLLFKREIGLQYGLIQPYKYISFTKQSHTEVIFADLVNQWREENHGVSSTNQMCMHPAYQHIIGMGEPVIPLILRELEKKSGRWFWALKSISREDPVAPEYRGNTKEMTKAWLEWGRNRGYRW